MEKTPPRNEKAQAILTVAHELFYQNGFNATGVDTIMAQAGISKRTLYKYYRSKEELIVAVIERYHQTSFSSLKAAIDQIDGTPQQKILAIFDIEQAVFCNPQFSGCLAAKALSEFSGKSPEIEQRYRAFKVAVEEMIATLCQQTGVAKPERLARQITVILEGTIFYAHLHMEPKIAEDAKAAVQIILENQ